MNKKMFDDETDVLASYERGEWSSTARLHEEIQRYQVYASSLSEQARLIHVTLPTEDFESIEQQAAKSGVSTEILIASVVHQFVTGQLVERSDA